MNEALRDPVEAPRDERGFTFVGPTIVYAYMQAAGLVNDHVAGCFRYAPCRAMAN